MSTVGPSAGEPSNDGNKQWDAKKYVETVEYAEYAK
jgi:hypothetical protein